MLRLSTVSESEMTSSEDYQKRNKERSEVLAKCITKLPEYQS